MPENKRIRLVRDAQRGATLLLVALSLVVLLGICALAIDLVWLYVGRSEAQRAADAGALAGATVFANSGCTSASGGCVAGGSQEAPARQEAIDVGSRNPVGGQAPTILASDVTFSYPTPQDPTVTVKVARDAAHGNPMPTFFIKIFGVTTANISAQATAEAYNPSGGGPPVGTKCLKPWLMPNCDWSRMVSSSDPNYNPTCQGAPGQYASKFVTNNSIVNPGPTPTGVIGQLMTIKPGNPTQANAPSKFYPIFLPPGQQPAQCPSCATGGSFGGGLPSGSYYQSNIECCNQTTITCGPTTMQAIVGNKVGPTATGVDCLIHESNGTGQDTISFSGTSPTVAAGSNNPLVAAGIISTGSTILPPTASSSVVTVPIYDGSTMCPGMGGCGAIPVQILGFMQVFVQEEDPLNQGTVYVYIMNVALCSGSGGGGSPPPVTNGGGSPIPVRLIHQ